jgi:hypothetical protein
MNDVNSVYRLAVFPAVGVVSTYNKSSFLFDSVSSASFWQKEEENIRYEHDPQ